METKHTPTPYIAGKPSSIVGWPIVAQSGRLICDMPMLPNGFPNKEAIDAETAATAAFIVRACNAHDELVKALNTALRFVEHYAPVMNGPINVFLTQSEALLAKAKGA